MVMNITKFIKEFPLKKLPGDYLTTEGRFLEQDLQMLKWLSFDVRLSNSNT